MDGWIKVEDRLPELCVIVLVCVRWGDRFERRLAALTDSGEWFYADNVEMRIYCIENLIEDDDVTHWMPLPELPGKSGKPMFAPDRHRRGRAKKRL